MPGSNPRLLCLLRWQAGSSLVLPGKPPSLVKLSYVLCIFATFCLSVHNGERMNVSSLCSSGSHVLLKTLPFIFCYHHPMEISVANSSSIVLCLIT